MPPRPAPLPRSFFESPAWQTAPKLLGCQIVRTFKEGAARVLITETEAYQGTEDLACHARSGLTKRNAAMFGPPGHAYVYFTYGMHWMLNIVCEAESYPAAVLIRAVHPIAGAELLESRRPNLAYRSNWLNGPAKLTQALGIDREENGADVCDCQAALYLAPGISVPLKAIQNGPRVGIAYAPEPWKSMPWRWRIRPQELSAAVAKV